MSSFAAALRSAVRRATAPEFAKLGRTVRQVRHDLRALRREGRATRETKRLVSPLRGKQGAKDTGPEIPPREVLAFRKGLGLGRHAFGKLVGVSHGTVYLWEVGRVAPRGFNRRKYVQAKRKYGRKAGLPAVSLEG